MNRRQFFLGVTALLTAVSGCSGRDTDSTPGAVADSGPDSYLPESTDAWEFQGTQEQEPAWSPLGATDGAIGQYQGPDGYSYEFVVMDSEEGLSEGNARSLACAGWQIALAHEGYAIAASSGTEQGPFTPEAPPSMPTTPAENKLDLVRELLMLSPRLTPEDIPRKTDCPYDSDKATQTHTSP